MKDLTSYITTDVVLATTTVAAATPQETAVQNTLDHESVAFIFGVGAFVFTAVNTLSIKLQHSDDDVTYADVPKEDVVEAFRADKDAFILLDDTADQSLTYQLGYIGDKEFVKGVITPVAATSVDCEAFTILGNPHNVPTPIQFKGVDA